MSKTFKIEGHEYKLQDLSEAGQSMYASLVFVGTSLAQKKDEIALLTRAKNGYIEDLKTEVIEKKTGVDLGALFGDD